MPRPDGRLYPSEIDALKKAEDAAKPVPVQAPAGMARAKVAPVVKPVAVIKRGRPTMADNLAKAVELIKPADAIGAFNGEVGARQLKANPETVKAIILSIESGLPIEKSCILHGVHRQYVDRWKKANPAVTAALEQAERRHEAKLVALVERHAERDPKSAHWLLERRHAWIPPQDRNNVATALAGGIVAMHKSLVDKVAEAKKADAINVKATAA